MSPGAQGMRRFSLDFAPESANVSRGYRQLHRRAERERAVNRSLDCPEFPRPKLIREWIPEAGWRNIPVPWLKSKRGAQPIRSLRT
jgi:hypothetical protein